MSDRTCLAAFIAAGSCPASLTIVREGDTIKIYTRATVNECGSEGTQVLIELTVAQYEQMVLESLQKLSGQ